MPELIHNRSGVGSTVLAVDLNKDGAMEVLTTTNRGTFIFWGKPKPAAKPAAKKQAEAIKRPVAASSLGCVPRTTHDGSYVLSSSFLLWKR